MESEDTDALERVDNFTGAVKRGQTNDGVALHDRPSASVE